MTHTFDSEVSLHYLLLWPTVCRRQSGKIQQCGLALLTTTSLQTRFFNLRLIHFRWMNAQKTTLSHCTEMVFTPFWSGGFTTAAKRNPPSGNWWKPAMCTVKKSGRIKSIQRMKHSHKKLFYKCCVVLKLKNLR